MKLFPARGGLMLVVLGVSTMFACPGVAQAKGAKSWSGPDRRARPGIGYFANQPTTARASTNGSRSFNGRVSNGRVVDGGGTVTPSVPQAVPPAATATEGIVRQFPRTAPVAAPRTTRIISGDAVVAYPSAPSPRIVSGRSVSGPSPMSGERIINERVITPGVVAGQPSPSAPVAVPTRPGRALTSAPVVTESAE